VFCLQRREKRATEPEHIDEQGHEDDSHAASLKKQQVRRPELYWRKDDYRREKGRTRQRVEQQLEYGERKQPHPENRDMLGILPQQRHDGAARNGPAEEPRKPCREGRSGAHCKVAKD
jgi:hypothetical protein